MNLNSFANEGGLRVALGVFTSTLISQVQSVSKSDLPCALHWELTFYFYCGVCIRRHVKRVHTHVFPRVIRPWFIDSAAKINKYTLVYHQL